MTLREVPLDAPVVAPKEVLHCWSPESGCWLPYPVWHKRMLDRQFEKINGPVPMNSPRRTRCYER